MLHALGPGPTTRGFQDVPNPVGQSAGTDQIGRPEGSLAERNLGPKPGYTDLWEKKGSLEGDGKPGGPMFPRNPPAL